MLARQSRRAISLGDALARNPLVSASAGVALAAAGAFAAFGLAAPSMALQSMVDGSVTVCATVPDDGPVAMGVPMVRNATGVEVVVTDLALIEPHGLRLAGFDLLPAASGSVGSSLDEAGPEPAGAPTPIAPGDELIVEVALVPTSQAAGRTEGVRLTYEVAGRLGTGSVDLMLAMETAAAGGTCGT